MATPATPTKPVIVPEAFSGEGSWEDWLDHFESVAAVNKWEEADKLLWLRVRMTGRAQKAFKNLPQASRASYATVRESLSERFEPASKRELYRTEFYARKKRKMEDWASLAEDLKSLADRAFSNLEEAARAHLVLTRYLEQLDNQQVAFSVKQKRPQSVDEAVTATLEMESYLNHSSRQVGQVGLEEAGQDTVVAAAVQSKQDTMMELMHSMMDRLEKLELRERRSQPPITRRFNPQRGQRSATRSVGSMRPIVCFRCQKEGHIARECTAPKPKQQGN